MNINDANQDVLDRILAGQPLLTGVGRALDLIPGMQPNLILHAGPPITWDRASGPMRGAIVGGLLFEGLAHTEAEAVALVERGEVRFDSCHHHATVGPMAGVTTASMCVYIVENRAFGNRAFSNLNEGYGKVLRYGAFSEDVLARLRWMTGTLGPAVGEALQRAGGLDMKGLIARQLTMGDEGHNRNTAGSATFGRLLAPHLARVGLPETALEQVLR
ncbi:MAG: DUF1116 domain-containing protein, partial [Armatimonadota bacterium]